MPVDQLKALRDLEQRKRDAEHDPVLKAEHEGAVKRYTTELPESVQDEDDPGEKAYREAMASGKSSYDLAKQANEMSSARFGSGGFSDFQERRKAITGVTRAAIEKHQAEPEPKDFRPKSGWKKLSTGETNQMIWDQMIGQGQSLQAAQADAERISKTHETHISATGSVIHFKKGAGISEPKKQVTKDTVDALNAAHPSKPPTTVFAGSAKPSRTGKPGRFGARVLGYATLGSNAVHIAPRTFTMEQAEHERNIAAGWHMADGAGSDPVAYVLAHEYGHATMDSQSRGGFGSPTPAEQDMSAALSPRNSPTWQTDISKYGKTNSKETLAEAHAAWFLTNGQTTNQTVQKIAAAGKWGT